MVNFMMCECYLRLKKKKKEVLRHKRLGTMAVIQPLHFHSWGSRYTLK